MSLNEVIIRLVMLSEHPAMPTMFQATLQKIIESISELEESESCEERKNGKCPFYAGE